MVADELKFYWSLYTLLYGQCSKNNSIRKNLVNGETYVKTIIKIRKWIVSKNDKEVDKYKLNMVS